MAKALCCARLLQEAELLVQILFASCQDDQEGQSRESWQRHYIWAYGRCGSKAF
jgi:hypothetical protein